jgi:hypothetical protein
MKWSKISDDGTIRTIDTKNDSLFDMLLDLYMDIFVDNKKK